MHDLQRDKMKQIQIIGFKEITDIKFNQIDGYGAREIEQFVKDYISEQLDDSEIDYEIVGIAVTGSRSRGLEKADSDLDIVVEIDTDVKEYVLFNILHENPYDIDGIPIDINPIRKEETGELGNYLHNVEKYLENKEETI